MPFCVFLEKNLFNGYVHRSGSLCALFNVKSNAIALVKGFKTGCVNA